MALNYSIAIQAVDEAGENIGSAKVHAYFKKNNSNSSDNIWDSDIRKTGGNGKTSFNLGDGSFLTSEGKIDNGDEILITVWLTDNDDVSIDDKGSKTVDTITRCVNFIHTVDTSASSYDETFTLLLIKNPVCDFNIPDVTNTGHNFEIINNSYITQGPFSGNDRDDLYQELSHFDEDLFLGLEIEKSKYDLVETVENKNGTDNFSYSYLDAGDYDSVFTVFNYLGISCNNSKSYHILYNKPNIDFDFTFTKLLNTDKHIGVGNDDELLTEQLSSTNYGDTWSKLGATFDWYIYDLTQDGSDNSDSYEDEDETFEPKKLYKCSSLDEPKQIILKINWNDGFDSHQETLELNPYLDIYNIIQNYDWITQKEYQNNDKYVPLGDDDLMTVQHTNTDGSSQDYNSNNQWISIKWDTIKKKNDGGEDNELLEFTSENGDDYTGVFSYYVRYHHDSDDSASINQKIVYWDGWVEVEKNLSYTYVSQNYTINHNYKWNTERYGDNKVIINDADMVKLINLSTFMPQNNQDIVQEDKYNITKDKYTSYTDDTVIADNEEFIYTSDNLTNEPEFYVHKDGNFNVLNTISYYDGYETKVSTSSKTLTAAVLTPNTKFFWSSRLGDNKTIVGRDDLVIFKNRSTVSDYYDTEYSPTGSRNLNIDWYISNYITADNFDNPSVIGGTTYSNDEDLIESFIDKEMTFEPEINFWTAKTEQNITLNFAYNDGYFNRDISLSKNIKTEAYSSLIPNANYTNTVPDRNTDILFSDNSSNNEIRIINTDWSLTDRYEDNSMSTDKQGEDNLQTWLNVLRDDEITTRVNSAESHTLSQDIIRWDNGFKLKTFVNSYSVSITTYNVNPGFTFLQIYETGPEIEFSNSGTKNGKAQLLTHDFEIEDKNNDGTDAFASYHNIAFSDKLEHVYKSVSNSPFEDDLYNKEVTIFQDYDDGFNRVYDTYTEDILVKPNRINQIFSTEPIRHTEDNETDAGIITGNNPIKFLDSSSTQRTDTDFIKNVKYTITESC